MAKYGKKAKEKVGKAMHERKRGTLKSGRSGKTVKSRKQAIAIGLSEARREGGKAPAKRSSAKKRSSSTTGRGRTTATSRKRSAGGAKARKTTKTSARRKTGTRSR